jgi:hypothetical protein
MFKYVKFTKVETENTVLEFRGDSEDVKVNHFDVDAVSIESEDEDAIDALVESQPSEIECEVIEKDEFKLIVENSAQLKRIRTVVKEKIALLYDIADEIAISKLADDDEKRVSYDDYVSTCLSFGYGLKEGIGY